MVRTAILVIAEFVTAALVYAGIAVLGTGEKSRAGREE
jgi:hypothetical protein